MKDDHRLIEQLKLDILIQPQPDNTTCGPTCLHAVYHYFDDDLPLHQVIRETGRLEEGGTFAALLGCHALRRDYDATIYTYNVQVFDPTWFSPKANLSDCLLAQMDAKPDPGLHLAIRAYLEFLELGGRIVMEDLSSQLIRRYLKRSVPILTGLSATYLYRETREYGPYGEPDDIRGFPVGHFVVLSGYDKTTRKVLIADPLMPNPLATEPTYHVDLDRLKCAILLGIMTFDANLLMIQPRDNDKELSGAGPDSRR